MVTTVEMKFEKRKRGDGAPIQQLDVAKIPQCVCSKNRTAVLYLR